MNLNNTDTERKQIRKRRQGQKMGTSIFRDWHETCQSGARQRGSDGATVEQKAQENFKRFYLANGERTRAAAWGAGCSPRRSRLAVAYRALFFAGRFFGVAWQLLIICKCNCHATPKKRYAKNQSALMPRHACWVLEQPAPHAAPLALSPIFDA
jgi:hypothetical protein